MITGLRAANARLRGLLAERDARITGLEVQVARIADLESLVADLQAQVADLAAKVKQNSLLTEQRSVFSQFSRLVLASRDTVADHDRRAGTGSRGPGGAPGRAGWSATGDRYEPYQLIDPDGAVMEAAAAFFRDLLAAGRAESTVRSYAYDLLRWLRFLDAAGVAWDRATRVDARDFSRWLQVSGKPAGPRSAGPARAAAGCRGRRWPVPYAPSVRAHSETVLRAFYDLHRDAGTGPVVNPFPLDRSRRGGRAHAHHNPMEPYRDERSGLFRPRVPSRIPRSVPDEEFNEIFARLPSHRDRALVAFYVSSGARASELLSATVRGVDPGRQLITVVRKGTARASAVARFD